MKLLHIALFLLLSPNLRSIHGFSSLDSLDTPGIRNTPIIRRLADDVSNRELWGPRTEIFDHSRLSRRNVKPGKLEWSYYPFHKKFSKLMIKPQTPTTSTHNNKIPKGKQTGLPHRADTACTEYVYNAFWDDDVIRNQFRRTRETTGHEKILAATNGRNLPDGNYGEGD